MYNELIVLIVNEKTDLDEAWHCLVAKQGGGLIRAADMALIGRDIVGKVSYKVSWEEAGYALKDHDHLAGTFAVVLFDDTRAEDRRRLAEAGMDSYFLRKMGEVLSPNSLAYVVYIPKESLIDSRRFLEILGEQQGELYHTTFRPQVEEVLLR